MVVALVETLGGGVRYFAVEEFVSGHRTVVGGRLTVAARSRNAQEESHLDGGWGERWGRGGGGVGRGRKEEEV